MNAKGFSQSDYENKTGFAVQENKPKQSQFQNRSRKAEFRRQGSVLSSRPSVLWLPRLLISTMLPLSKPGNDRYHSRRIGRCSSTVEHSFRKAGVEGPNPSIGFMTMHGNDTPKEISEIQYGLYRSMSPAKKMTLLFDAYHTGRILAMAGIRMLNPSATEAEIRQIWVRQRLGEKLFTEAYGNVRNG